MDERKRVAAVDLASEMLAESAGLLLDAGMEVYGSLRSSGFGSAQPVRLLISGDRLPAECALPGPLQLVMCEFTTEAYGRQRLTRLSGVKLTGRTVAEL